MSARDRKDARRIEAAFEHDALGDSGSSNRRHGRGRGGERERETLESGPVRSRRREAFGGALTTEPTTQPVQPVQSVQPISTSPQPREEDQIFFSSTEVDSVTAE
jgi:E3 ubiquitin-protein ligase ZNF598